MSSSSESTVDVSRKTHAEDRPFVCSFPGCKRRFRQKSNEITHQRVHGRHIVYSCSIECCNERFPSANERCPIHGYARKVRKVVDVNEPTELAKSTSPKRVIEAAYALVTLSQQMKVSVQVSCNGHD